MLCFVLYLALRDEAQPLGKLDRRRILDDFQIDVFELQQSAASIGELRDRPRRAVACRDRAGQCGTIGRRESP